MPTFDEKFYTDTHSEELASSDKSALEHFITEGWEAGEQANPDGETLTGDEIVAEAVQLAPEDLLTLISKMDAGDMRAVDADSAALDVHAIMQSDFEVFKNMDADEAAALAFDQPETLAKMDVSDLEYMSSGDSFDMGAQMQGLEDAQLATVIGGLENEGMAFLNSGMEGFDMAGRVGTMGDEHFAAAVGQMGADGMAFMSDSLDGF